MNGSRTIFNATFLNCSRRLCYFSFAQKSNPKHNFLKKSLQLKISWQNSNVKKLFSVQSIQNSQTLGAVANDNNYKHHTPVLLNETLNGLSLKENGVYLDMTFGAGGHSRKILESHKNITLYSLDRDPTTHQHSEELKKDFPDRFHPMIGKFSELPAILEEKEIGANYFAGVLMDLGVSSMQFNTPERGFMLSKDGPLDMRMDCDRFPDTPSAADVLCHIDEESLRKVLKFYGGEKKAKAISRAIVESRLSFRRFNTTKELANLIETIFNAESTMDKLQRYAHPATKTFQALRILVNDELNELDLGIRLAHYYLQLGGKIVVISFHSLEDTIVKRHFLGSEVDETPDTIGQPKWKEAYKNPLITFTCNEIKNTVHKPWKPLYKHVVLPSEDEVMFNPRSRSAKLRVATKANYVY